MKEASRSWLSILQSRLSADPAILQDQLQVTTAAVAQGPLAGSDLEPLAPPAPRRHVHQCKAWPQEPTCSIAGRFDYSSWTPPVCDLSELDRSLRRCCATHNWGA